MKFFVKHLSVQRSGVLFMLVIQTSVFLFGVLIVLGINAFLNDEQDYAAIGSLMALMGTLFGSLARGGSGPVRYRLAVSMGHTRRAYLLTDPLVTAINLLFGVGFACVLNKLELWLYGLLYPGWELDFNLFDVLKLPYMLLLVVGVCLLDFCLGALQLQFGAKALAVIWFPLCCGPMVVINSVEAAEEGGSSLLAQIGHGLLFLAGLLRPAAWAAVGVVALLAMVGFSAVCYRRAEVRM